MCMQVYRMKCACQGAGLRLAGTAKGSLENEKCQMAGTAQHFVFCNSSSSSSDCPTARRGWRCVLGGACRRNHFARRATSRIGTVAVAARCAVPPDRWKAYNARVVTVRAGTVVRTGALVSSCCDTVPHLRASCSVDVPRYVFLCGSLRFRCLLVLYLIWFSGQRFPFVEFRDFRV